MLLLALSSVLIVLFIITSLCIIAASMSENSKRDFSKPGAVCISDATVVVSRSTLWLVSQPSRGLGALRRIIVYVVNEAQCPGRRNQSQRMNAVHSYNFDVYQRPSSVLYSPS